MSNVKVIVGVVALAAVAAVGGTYMAGSRAENVFREKLPGWIKPSSGVTVETVNYSRGFLSSTAQTKWSVNAGEELPAFDFTMNHVIKHGPLSAGGSVANVHSELQTPAEIAEIAKTAFGDRALLVVDSDIGWGGTQTHRIGSPEYRGEVPEIGTVFWGGVSGDITISGDGSRVQTNIGFPGLAANDGNEQKIELGAMTLTGDQVRLAPHSFWTGSSNFDVAKIEVKIEDNPAVLLEQVSLGVDLALKEPVVDFVFKLGLSKADIGGEKFENFISSLVYENIDAVAIDNIVRIAEDAASVTDFNEKLDGALLEQAPAFLGRKPVFALRDVAVTFPEGGAKLDLRVAYTGSGDVGSFNPMTDLDGQFNLSLPRAFLVRVIGELQRDSVSGYAGDADAGDIDGIVETQVEQQLAVLAASGLAVENEGKLSTAISYKNGGFEVNGKPFDSSAFKNMLPF
jgi:uncharacterized protein YdgA (DUF945 family)